VPENLSTAANYACVECVTYALATQLVVTVPGPLSDAATQQLAAIWADLQEFGAQIEGVPLSELRTRLNGFEARILDVVRPEVTEAPATTTATSGAAGGSTSAGAPVTTSGARASGTTGAAATGTAAEPSATGSSGTTSGPPPTSASPTAEATPAAGTADPTATPSG